MSKITKEFEKVIKDGIKQGQQQTGAPSIITKEDREQAGAQIVAAWYVRLWNWIMGR